MESEIEKLMERMAVYETVAKKAEEDSASSIKATAENESRLKSIQHRIDEAEGREDAIIRDIHEIRMTLLAQETRIGTTVSLLKVFGSLVTLLSILVNIGRWLLL